MNWYKCFIAGENFPGALVGEDSLVGFFVTRFVQAESAEDAEHAGFCTLKDEDSLKLPEGISPPAAAKVYFEKIEEVDEGDVPSVPPGFSFFPMQPP